MKPEAFAGRLRRLREKAGLSVAGLASAAGLGRQAVYKLERGERPDPSLSTLLRLARALGVGLSAFDDLTI